MRTASFRRSRRKPGARTALTRRTSMGKKSSQAPKSPDPKQTAAAQTSANIGTALAEGIMNRVNQVTPDGALTYARAGTTAWTDPPTGKTYEIPNYTATTTLSPEQQRTKAQS